MNILFIFLISAESFLPITWTNKAAMPQALASCGGAVIGDTVYVIGGRDSAGNRYATNYIYLPATDSWASRANMPTPRAHLGCVYANGKIYAIGGWVGSTASGTCEEFDPVSNTWQTRASMPTPRYTLAIAAVAGKIYVFGGMNMSGQIFSTVEEYDPVGNIWATKTPMPTARMGPACAVIRDTVYVYGGSTVVGGGLTTVNEYYVPATDTWGTKANMPSARYCMAGFTNQNRVYALGGYDYYNYLSLCQAYDPSSDTWSTETPMQNARQSLPAAVVGNCVYAIAGWNNGALNYNEEGLLVTGVAENDADGSQDMNLHVFPNPFHDRTNIRLTISDAVSVYGSVSMRIYDTSGRLVKLFSLPTAYSLLPTVVWNGTDQTGHELPGGVYLLVAEFNRIRQSQKLIIVR
jgi:N-acetylneuraminic acid mutarotase